MRERRERLQKIEGETSAPQDYALLFDHAPVAYLVLDSLGCIVVANERACSMLHVERTALEGGSFSDFLPQGELGAWNRHCEALRSTERKRVVELCLTRRGGSAFPVRGECSLGQGAGQILLTLSDVSESEERYRHLVEHRLDVLCKINELGIMLYCSPQIEMYGFVMSEVVGSHFLDYVHPDDREMVAVNFMEALADRKVLVSEFRVPLPDGRICWFEDRSNWLEDGEGEGAELNVALRDITARKEVERAREQIDYHRKLALDAARLGWWYVDPESKGVTFDVRYAEMFGLEGRARTLDEIMEQVFPDDRAAVWAQIEDALNPTLNKPFHVEHRIQRPDGEIRWLEVHGMAVFEGDGKAQPISSFVGTVGDITEQKRARDALQQRVLALTQPVNESRGIVFEELFDLPRIQKIQDEFADAMGVASVIVRLDGSEVTRPSNFSDLCGEVVRGSAALAQQCLKAKMSEAMGVRSEPEVNVCSVCGVWFAGAPIVVEGRHIANWLVGQVRDEMQDDQAVGAISIPNGVDSQAFVSAYQRVPKMSLSQFKGIVKALYILASQLSASAYQNVVQARFIAVQEKAKNDLRESEVRYRRLFETVSDAIVVFDEASEEFVNVNDAALKMYGYSRSEFLGLKRNDISVEAGAVRDAFWVSTGGWFPAFPCRLHQKNGGAVFPVETSACTFESEGRTLVCSVVRDVSGRMLREQEIQKSREELRHLASELSLAEQHEQQRVATVLHDGLGQLLSSAYLRLDMIRQREFPESVRSSLEKICEIVESSLQETRLLTFDLSCPMLTELGLAAAVENLCRTMSSGQGIAFGFLSDLRDPLALKMDHKIVIYRAVRESLMNVIKHSGAENAQVLMIRRQDELIIRVEDDGTGFDASKAGSGFSRSGGYGLFSISESIRHIGGSMRVESCPGDGAQVQICVPLTED